jgi:hypothetical protein
MKGEKIELSQRQLQRFRVMGFVEVRRITLREAAGKAVILPSRLPDPRDPAFR